MKKTTNDKEKKISNEQHFAEIINLKERMIQNAWGKEQKNAIEVMDFLESIPHQEADNIVAAIFAMILTEVEIGLKLIDTGEHDFEEHEFFFFDQIEDRFILEQQRNKCYFCNPMIDPNETEFGPGVHLCIFHKLKLANFVEALGIPADAVWPDVRGREKVQKHRIVLNHKYRKVKNNGENA